MSNIHTCPFCAASLSGELSTDKAVRCPSCKRRFVVKELAPRKEWL
jgi:DNA-directed RNA polymerase subunit RPC12/RpoP